MLDNQKLSQISDDKQIGFINGSLGLSDVGIPSKATPIEQLAGNLPEGNKTKGNGEIINAGGLTELFTNLIKSIAKEDDS